MYTCTRNARAHCIMYIVQHTHTVTVYTIAKLSTFELCALTNRCSHPIGWKYCAHKYSTFNLFAIWSYFKENMTFLPHLTAYDRGDRSANSIRSIFRLFQESPVASCALILCKVYAGADAGAIEKNQARKVIKCVNTLKMLFKWMQKSFSSDDSAENLILFLSLSRPYFYSIYMNFISELRLFFTVRVIAAFVITQYRNLFCAHFSLSLCCHKRKHFLVCARVCADLFSRQHIAISLHIILLVRMRYSVAVYRPSLGEYDRNMCVIFKNELFPQIWILCWYFECYK